MTQFLLPKVRKRLRRQKPTDDAFRAWIQRQPSCLSGRFSESVDGECRNLACHVRRAGSSGTGYKGLFSCVPMTDEEHKLQHHYGELSCLFSCKPDLGIGTFHEAKVWFDQQAAKYREEWFRMHPEDRP